MPPRDLEEEFKTLLAQYKLNCRDKDTKDKFAKLLIDILQIESNSQRWTELAGTFPPRIQLWAMRKHTNSFCKRLKLKKPQVARWVAKVQLDLQHMRLKKLGVIEDEELRKETEAPYEQCKKRCAELMLDAIRESEPTTLTGLRAVMDATFNHNIQFLLLNQMRKELCRIMGPVLSKFETYTLFKKGVQAEILYEKYTQRQSEETSLEYHNFVHTSLAEPLLRELVENGVGLSVLDKYPLVAQYHVIGNLQSPLRAALGDKVTCADLREMAGNLKLEIDPGTDVTRLVTLFKQILFRIKVFDKHNISDTTTTAELTILDRMRADIKIIPIRITMAIIMEATEPEGLDTRLVDAFHLIPLKYMMHSLVLYESSIIEATPDELVGMVTKAIVFMIKTYLN
jgi:hypothetical protein